MSSNTPDTGGDGSDELRFTYRNWRGEIAERRVKASSVRMRFGTSDFHLEPQSLMTAIDLDRNAGRDFAWKDIVRPAEPETEEVEALRAANAMLQSRPTAEATIAQIVAYAETIAWQAGVGSLETAGQIVSFLADRPEMLLAFMDGSLSAIDTDLLDHHAGRLTWHGMDGKVHAPDPAKAGRFRQPGNVQKGRP